MSNHQGLSGVGNDSKHQYIISLLIHTFARKFSKSTYKNHYAFPELQLRPISPKIPDLVICKISRSKLKPVILFEICDSTALNSDTKKLNELMLTFPSIKECFIINKDDNTTYRIYRKKSNEPTQPRKSDRCKTFNLHISEIINEASLINQYPISQ